MSPGGAGASLIVHEVLGFGRSGTTIAGRLLADALGAHPVDELVMVWRRGVLEDRACTCGERFSACVFWRAVAAECPELRDHVVAQRIDATLVAITRPRSTALACTGHGRDRLARTTPAAFREAQGSLYAAVARVAGATSLVDASKAPVLGLQLRAIAGLDLRPWHVVRDPRHVASSWARPPRLPADAAPLPATTPLRAAAAWLLVNTATEAALRALGGGPRLRLEDLAADPDRALAAAAVQRTDQGDHAPAVVHTMAGNPGVRLASGRPAVRRDMEAPALSRAQRLAVTAMAAPLLPRYGYAWRS